MGQNSNIFEYLWNFFWNFFIELQDIINLMLFNIYSYLKTFTFAFTVFILSSFNSIFSLIFSISVSSKNESTSLNIDIRYIIDIIDKSETLSKLRVTIFVSSFFKFKQILFKSLTNSIQV